MTRIYDKIKYPMKNDYSRQCRRRIENFRKWFRQLCILEYNIAMSPNQYLVNWYLIKMSKQHNYYELNIGFFWGQEKTHTQIVRHFISFTENWSEVFVADNAHLAVALDFTAVHQADHRSPWTKTHANTIGRAKQTNS